MLKELFEEFKNVSQVSEDEVIINHDGFEVECFEVGSDYDLIVSKDGDYIVSYLGIMPENVSSVIRCLSY